MAISNNMDQLVIARRLMLHAQRMEDRRKGKQVDEKSLREEMEEDQALISGAAPVEGVTAQEYTQKVDDVQIKLPELFARLREIESRGIQTGAEQAAPARQAAQVEINYEQVIEREASMTYVELEKVDGLVRRSQTLAETDRYKFDFSDGTTFKITDKWTNRSTTIWGDPHVDVDDLQGANDGDFQDMQGSNSHTTLMLLDGTRVTFTAQDTGVIEKVDIFKGSQRLTGTGEAARGWTRQNGLFASEVGNSAGYASSVQKGDVVYAGGDGNDWFTGDGKLLWGQTTGPIVNTRPLSVLQLEYHEKITQQVSVQVINAQA